MPSIGRKARTSAPERRQSAKTSATEARGHSADKDHSTDLHWTPATEQDRSLADQIQSKTYAKISNFMRHNDRPGRIRPGDQAMDNPNVVVLEDHHQLGGPFVLDGRVEVSGQAGKGHDVLSADFTEYCYIPEEQNSEFSGYYLGDRFQMSKLDEGGYILRETSFAKEASTGEGLRDRFTELHLGTEGEILTMKSKDGAFTRSVIFQESP